MWGRKGLGTDIAHHIVQSHQAWGVASKTPTAVLFLDIKSAFYTLLRQTFAELPSNNAVFAAVMTKLGLTQHQLEGLVAQASQDQDTFRLSDHLHRILSDLMQNTYFTVQGLPCPCQTTRGTRPGDPIADVMFNMAMTNILGFLQSHGPSRSGALDR